MRNFTSVDDLKGSQPGEDLPAAINALVQKALAYKADAFKDGTLGANKRIGCLFLNPSMRTRLSTQIAAQKPGYGNNRF
jgi:N-succinyl-L-ornithine transcarbamylase